jgi:hypothetical protein
MHDVTCIQQQGEFKDEYADLLRQQLFPEYILHLCDDDLFINDVTQEEFEMLLEQYTDDVCCMSLRMNPLCDYCYPAIKKEMVIPNFIESDKFLKWDWTKYDPLTDWGYPHCINSHIYKIQYYKNLVKDIHPIHVNDLEGQMNHKRDFTKPYMISFKETKVYNVMNNFTKGYDNTINYGMSVERLNKELMNNKIISTENLYGLKDTKVHGSIEYIFKDMF